ncbi:hypothetical protein [Nocardioides sp.]|uniref:hypothetical protein n=1 Tax=Nocardioides sp. TaxID=35761 RepID=UPI002ED07887
MDHVTNRQTAPAPAPPMPLFDVVAFGCLTLLALTERFEALPAAVAALGSARYILSQPPHGETGQHPPL